MSKKNFQTGLEINEQTARFLILEHRHGATRIHAHQECALQDLKNHSLPEVAIGLPNNSTISNILETSLALQDDELESHIQLELPQLFPNADAELYFDFAPIHTDTEQGIQKLFILATHKKILDQKMKMLKNLGVTVSAAEMNGAAQYRCVRYLYPELPEDILLVQCEKNHRDVILAKDTLLVSTPLSCSGNIEQAIEWLLASHPQASPTHIVLMGPCPPTMPTPVKLPVHTIRLESLGLSPEWNTVLGLALRNLI